jgi:ubiquinone/menaquinone biosynthesis C-methylase UbiE
VTGDFIETVVSHVETATVARLCVSTSGCTLLDVASRADRTQHDQAVLAVGVDRSPEILTHSAGRGPVAAADVRALPFPALTFDVVSCRLVLGRVREMENVYAELSRVCCMGGVVVVTDHSAESVAEAGKATNEAHALVRFSHSIERQAVAAYEVGLRLERRQDGIIDQAVLSMFLEAGLRSDFDRLLGVPIVRALVWRKNAA